MINFREFKLEIIFISLVAAAIIVACYIGLRRMNFEFKLNRIEVTMRYDDMFGMCKLTGSKNPVELMPNLMSVFRNIGLTSVIVEEETVETLKDMGKITCLTGSEIKDVFRAQGLVNIYMWEQIQDKSIEGSHIFLIMENKGLYERIKANLSNVLAPKFVRTYRDVWHIFGGEVVHNYILEVSMPYERIKDIGVGFETGDIQMVRDIGLNVILEMKSFRAQNREAIDFKFAGIMDWDNITCIVFKGDAILGHRDLLGVTQKWMIEKDLFLIVPHDLNQKGISYFTKSKNFLMRTVRMQSISSDSSGRLSADALIRKCMKSIEENKVRVLVLSPNFKDEEEVLHSTRGYLEKLITEIRKHDYVPETVRVREGYRIGAFLYFLLILGIISSMIALYSYVFHVSNAWQIAILAVALFAVFLITGFLGGIVARKFVAFVAGVFYPCFSIFILKRDLELKLEVENFYYAALLITLKVVFITIVGAILIMGLLSSSEFVLGGETFLWSPLAIILPPALATIYWYSKEEKYEYFTHQLKEHVNWFEFIGVALVVMLLFVFKNTWVSYLKSAWESIESFRDVSLSVGFRLRESLICYPVIMTAVALYISDVKRNLYMLIFVGTIGLVFLLRSFCGIDSSLIFSFKAGFNELWFGCLIGLGIIWTIKFFRRG